MNFLSRDWRNRHLLPISGYRDLGGGGGTPAAPDYVGAARAQGQLQQQNLNTQIAANRPNISTPTGAMNWTSHVETDPATGQQVTRWSQNVTNTPALSQAQMDQQDITRQRSQMAREMMGNVSPMQTPDWSTLTPRQALPQATSNIPQIQGRQLQESVGAPGADTRRKVEDAYYDAATRRLDPQWQDRASSLEADLANKGINVGSDAYTRAQRDFGFQRDDAYGQARDQAIKAGGDEMARDFNIDLQRGNFANSAQNTEFSQEAQAQSQNANLQNQQFQQGIQGATTAQTLRQQQIAEEMQRQGYPIDMINKFLQGQQVQDPNFPGFSQAGAAQAPDLVGAANSQYGAGLDSYNASQAQAASQRQAYTQYAMLAAYMMSERHLKQNITEVLSNIGIYEFEYLPELGVPGRHTGVMVDELEGTPLEHLIVDTPFGVRMVNYGGLIMHMRAALRQQAAEIERLKGQLQ